MIRKTVLVTGGAGFVGSHLCKALLERGDHVVCIDNFISGRLSNIEPLKKNPEFDLLIHDVTEPYNFYVDEIFNLACPASPIFYQKDPIATYKTTVLGAINALDLALRWNAKIFQASTSEVYGDALVHPQPESYWGNVNPHGVRSCYDEGKRGAESLFFDYRRKHGIRIKVARIFNTYGPNMNIDDGRVVSNFIIQALQNRDITVYGDGKQTRSFCYVDDLIRGMLALMDSDDSVTGPVNLGNPGEFTMLELAEKVIKQTGSKSKLAFLPLPGDDPRVRRPDITLAGELLGWKPEIPLDEGLRLTIEYFKGII
ncbi:SDR family oxidoreductase [bacterium]|nr:SDR family oxidoreductase [bacterium]MBQ4438172.1 SDR family oxidoreductase [bacterium]